MTFGQYLDGIRGKRITVIGAGISNTPLIERLLMTGLNTTVCDKRAKDALGETAKRFEALGAKLRLGDDYLADLDADVIFRTPGLMPSNPALRDAARHGAILTSEMEVFFDVCPCMTIAVTGSDGKTTTTSIIAEILKREHKTVYTGGNIGRPLLCCADDMHAGDIAVLELSSFQLITMKKSPDIAVITNISPNHLDVHADMEEYIEAKRNIFQHQTSSGTAVFNYDNGFTKAFAGEVIGGAVFFSRLESVRDGFYLQGGTIREAKKGSFSAVMQADEIRLPGAHNIENYMAAFAAVRDIAGRPAMLETARNFSGVSHRIELIRENRGVRYYNDSIASSPTRTIAGLRAFNQKVILIAGGKDKGLAFDELAEEIIKGVKTLVLTGLTAEQIQSAVVSTPGYTGEPDIIIQEEFTDAVLAASKAARKGDVVLLSPACTSFDRFRNFEERGDRFRDIVLSLD